MKAVIRGIGSYLPDRILPNAELSKLVDTSDEWIRERTGIHQRHIAADGEYTSDLGVKAASAALEHAGLTSDDLDLIVVATSTPDFTFPATATIIQEKLGMHHGAAFDVQAVCSGFIYGSHVVNAMLKSGAAKSALLIGAETFSRILDWEDRGTCVLFGDGAGAMVLQAEENPENEAGILHSYVRSDGRHREMLFVDGGPSRTRKPLGICACWVIKSLNMRLQILRRSCEIVQTKLAYRFQRLTGLYRTKLINAF